MPFVLKCSAISVFLILSLRSVASGQTVDRKFYLPPEQVTVLPILHVPKGLPAPDEKIAKLIDRHVQWSRDRYQELLGTTFEIADTKTLLFRGRYTLEQYRAFDNKVGAHIHAQHLEYLNVNRFNCPYVLLTILYNPQDGFPSGRGGSMNGGFNTGGGTVLMSSYSFTDQPNAQSTLQHELGHAFGLPHVDKYGYQLRGDNSSIMAYNKNHHTNRFKASDTPGIFIPEDIRGLALNDRVFPNLEFNPAMHIPPGYQIKPRIVSNAAGSYPGSLDYKLEATTDAGEMLNTKIQNAILGRIEPSPGPEISFNRGSMWHSDVVAEEAHVDIKFPFAVELSAIKIYSGHSGQIHPVTTVRILTVAQGGSTQEVGKSEFSSRDGEIRFRPTEASTWRLALTPGSSRKITLRGIRFYSGSTEIFRPQICLVAP